MLESSASETCFVVLLSVISVVLMNLLIKMRNVCISITSLVTAMIRCRRHTALGHLDR
jgi:hypothetical protein